MQRTLRRYFDPSIPSAEVKPTQISKVCLHEVLCWKVLGAQTCKFQVNTLLQLLLMGLTTVSPLLPFDTSIPLLYLQ